jgi:hypothetical protein
MDLKQRKLTKSEWDGIEIPVHKDEIEILNLIVNGFSNVHLKVNKTDSMFTQLKIEYNAQIEEFLYSKFFADKIRTLVERHNVPFIQFNNGNSSSKRPKNVQQETTGDYHVNVGTIVKLKSGDQIRMSRLDINSIGSDSNMYEVVLFNNLEKMLEYKSAGKKKMDVLLLHIE